MRKRIEPDSTVSAGFFRSPKSRGPSSTATPEGLRRLWPNADRVACLASTSSPRELLTRSWLRFMRSKATSPSSSSLLPGRRISPWPKPSNSLPSRSPGTSRPCRAVHHEPSQRSADSTPASERGNQRTELGDGASGHTPYALLHSSGNRHCAGHSECAHHGRPCRRSGSPCQYRRRAPRTAVHAGQNRLLCSVSDDDTFAGVPRG